MTNGIKELQEELAKALKLQEEVTYLKSKNARLEEFIKSKDDDIRELNREIGELEEQVEELEGGLMSGGDFRYQVTALLGLPVGSELADIYNEIERRISICSDAASVGR